MRPTHAGQRGPLALVLTLLLSACSGGTQEGADAGTGDAAEADAGAGSGDAAIACVDGDRDGDGTCDADDGCPDDGLKAEPGACGCGVADSDGDGDGAADCVDACPGDPGKIEPGICDCGTADVDPDGDGTMSCLDSCPADPGKVLPGACGCGIADTDGDADGQVDCGEGCPADPDKSAPGICGCGIPDEDSDSDGTVDCLDGCPGDGGKIMPGACGCGTADTDTDSDGTANCIDACPGDAGKVSPGVCGCGTSDADGDSDGTADCNDGCPGDPAKVGPGVCGCGAPDQDGDSDGLLDCQEQCPRDPDKVEPGLCGCGNVDDPDFSGPRDEVMFATAAITGGNLRAGQATGQEGADATCQDAAAAAGLGRAFVAVLGGGTIGTLADRVRLCGSVRSRGGTLLFASRRDMSASGGGVPQATAITDAQGAAVPAAAPAWTGLDGEGAVSPASCGSFMSNASSLQGRIGSFASTTPGGWLSAATLACSASARLYCVSQLPPDVVGLAVTPGTAKVLLAVTSTAQLTATARFSYGPRRDVSADATWQSSDPELATVDAGTVTFAGPGVVTITASYGGFSHMATVTATDKEHRIFITAEQWSLGSDDNVAFQLGNNAKCQAAASAAGLAGNWLGVYGTGFVRDNLAPVTIDGAVFNLAGDLVGFPNIGAAAPVTTDEYGTALPAGATTWTSECAYDFLANADVACYGTPSALCVAKVTCGGTRRRLCVSR